MSQFNPPTILATLVGLILVAGCGSKEQDEDGGGGQDRGDAARQTAVQKDDPASIVKPVSEGGSDGEIPLEAIGLVDDSLHREPAKTPWLGAVSYTHLTLPTKIV